MAEEKNEKVKSALDEMKYLTGDAEIRRMAELRDRWERDRNGELAYAKGEGRKEGIKEGRKKEKIETAKKMLEEGISLEKVIKITGLAKEEIMN